MYGLFFRLLVLFIPLKADAQAFEGTIKFAQQSLSDTLFYSYHVKDNWVRIDEFDKRQAIMSYTLINLRDNTIQAVNMREKIYRHLPLRPFHGIQSNEFEVIKYENCKTIKGYQCYQWRVRNKDKDTEVMYWVAKDNFDFFINLLKLLNRTEKTSTYFLIINDSQGFFPFEATERSLLWEPRMKVVVLDIRKTKLDASLFQIPADYKLIGN